MALEEIKAGSKASSQLLNDNFHYLQDLVGELSIKIDGNDATVDSKIATSKNSLTNQITALETSVNASIDEVEAKVDKVSSDTSTELKGRVFKQSAKTIGIGTTSLSSYLPNDGYSYLVWVNANAEGKGDLYLTIKTDVMTTARYVYRADNDAGRWSRAYFFGAIPVGTGRSITTSGSADSITLCGYCKM